MHIIYNLNPFSLSCLTIFFTGVSIVLITLFFGRKSLLFRLWILFNISVAIWGGGAFFLSYVSMESTAILVSKVSLVGVIFIPVLFFHIACVLSESYSKKAIILVYSQGLIATLADIGNAFTTKIQYAFDTFYYPVAVGFTYHVLYLSWIGIIFYGCKQLFNAYRQSKGVKRIQIVYFLIGTTIGLLGGAINFLPVFGIKVYPYRIS